MANPNRQSQPDIKRTVQGVQNRGFDEEYQVPAVELLVENADQDALVRLGELHFSKGLVPEEYDYIALTYVSSGNGEGEVETAVYKKGGSGGTTVATLTLGYNASNKLTSVTRT